MLKPVRIRIDSFQSIEKLEFEVSGFTCVTGPTNIGKSAIIRAISSAILNKSVVGSVRKGKKFCTVEVDGLKWEKGERVGRYWVPGEKDEGGNPKPRDGIGQGQTEVTQLMGFRSVKVGDKYINPWLATQFDPIFLMQDSGPAVTDFISDITHLKVLQDAIVVCTTARQRLLQSVKEREDGLAAVTAREASLEGLDNLLRAEKDLVLQMESLEEYGRAIARLRHFISAIDSESASMASLAPARDVRVPRAPSDPAVSLIPLARLWTDIEEAAMRVSPIKGIMKVVVPDAPDTEELESLRRTSRFLSIPALAESVSMLEAAKRVVVPEAGWPGLGSLLRASGLLSEIEATRSLIAVLDARIPATPDLPVPVFSNAGGAAWAANAMARMEKEASSISAMKDQLEKVEAEIAETSAELAKIPTCPTCSQVFVRPHQHV
jgi:hypothetical protein